MHSTEVFSAEKLLRSGCHPHMDRPAVTGGAPKGEHLQMTYRSMSPRINCAAALPLGRHKSTMLVAGRRMAGMAALIVLTGRSTATGFRPMWRSF